MAIEFGHDGRGKYKGIALVDSITLKEYPFDGLLTGDDQIDVSKLTGTEIYGKDFLNIADRKSALEHLGITEEMLTPGGEGKEGPIGKDGPQGIQGKEGPPGPQGETGPQGIPGNDGVSDIPGPPGESGPAGETGSEGPQGAPGPEGPTGPAGRDGLDGRPGVNGADGVAGKAGPAGVQGVAGPAGAQGAQGTQGDRGFTGAQGNPGVRGLTGPVGPAGLNWRGAYDNTVNYDKDSAVGFQGATYFSIIDNNLGVPPMPSNSSWALLAAQGAQGDTGPRGPNGVDGSNGLPGPQGPQGAQGVAGKAGTNGVDGAQGPRGNDGPIGPAGKDAVAPKGGTPGQVLSKKSGTDGDIQWASPYPTFRGAMIRCTDNTTIKNGIPVSMPTTVYESGGKFIGTDKTRLTVPAGVNFVRLTASHGGVTTANTIGDKFWYYIKKNTTSFYGTTLASMVSAYSNHSFLFTTAVVPVVEGDYFTFDITFAGKTGGTVSAFTTLSIEVVG